MGARSKRTNCPNPGRFGRIAVPLADLRRKADNDLTPEMQLLFGDRVDVLTSNGGWSLVGVKNPISNALDYTGWVEDSTISFDITRPTHRVTALRAPVFSGPDLKSRIQFFLPLGARCVMAGEAIGNGGGYLELKAGGFLSTRHAVPIDAPFVEDFVDTAEMLQALPYVWGGNGPDGMDCSGLVRMALHEAGITCPRNADQQEEALGESVTPDADLMNLRRGDLIFWPGHVGIMQTSGRLLHANAHHMCVATEPLHEAVGRIGPIRTVKRL